MGMRIDTISCGEDRCIARREKELQVAAATAARGEITTKRVC
jgi:hypothetical protein